MNNLPILAQDSNEQKKMSSKEIAELTGKEHAHVIRDIKTLIDNLKKDDPKMDDLDFQVVTDTRNYVSEFLLSQDGAMCLASGYNPLLRMKIIKRWKELELNSIPKPMTLLETAKALVASLEMIESQKIAIDNMSVAFNHESQWLSILKIAIHNKTKETEFNWRVLKKASKEMGYEVKQMPSRRYKFQNIYHVSVWKKCYPFMKYDFKDISI